MPRRFQGIALCALACVLMDRPALAQAPSGQFEAFCGGEIERTRTYIRCPDRMELVQGTTHVFADRGEWFLEENRTVLEGNVALSQGDNWISADRAEFDTLTQLGTFHNATGVSRIESRAGGTSRPGVAPMVSGRDNVVYFFGEVVEKRGSKRYRITNGGFTTCVQPTPRWDLYAGTVDLNVDSYTLLRNVVFNVKNVPLLYLPILYYPTNEDGRATGFLLPSYGSTTLLGQTIGNQFFWAINRSHDATFMHEWYSRGGQALGGEYRYNLGSGTGDANIRLIDEVATTDSTTSSTKSYSLQGGATQTLPGNFRARASVDYFSSLATMQSYNTDVYQASNGRRYVGGNVTGGGRTYTMNATLDYREQFYDVTNSVVNGNLPRMTISRNERPLVSGSPLYLSVGGEYAGLIRRQRIGDVSIDSGLQRIDVTPRLRYPFKAWPFFTVNTAAAWRDTFYTRSIDPAGVIVDEALNRSYVTLQANSIGPVLTRVWDTPGSGYADRFKHTIEPFANLTWTSAIDNFDQIVQTDGVDTVVGGTRTLNYGVNNRFYARRRSGRGAVAQEILFVELSQTHYSNALAARFDPRYSTSFTAGELSQFSPLLLSARTTPSPAVNATLRAEVDSQHRELRTMTASGSYTIGGRLQTSGGWTKKFFVEGLPGFDDPAFLDHYLNGSANFQTADNQYGGAYSFNFDVRLSRLLQQRITAFYNAQCCGIAAEYQTYNLSGVTGVTVEADRRFFISFTLAGLGNFSPMNGALGGVPR
jgi:LPS-assembly protein